MHTEHEKIIHITVDLMNDDETDNGKLLRTLLFCASLVAINHSAPLEMINKILKKMYTKTSIQLSNGANWLPPGEA